MPSEVQRKVAWLSQPFGVWPVRTKQDVIRADEILQLTEVVLVERSDPDVLAMWKRYEECCTYGKLSDLAEVDEMFAGFVPFDL